MRKKIDKIIPKVMMKLGTKPNHKGFHYLRVGIKYCIENPESVTNFTKLIYPKLSEMFDTTPTAVERAVRTAIGSGWHMRDKKFAEEIFRNLLQSQNDMPSNTVYVSAISEWLNTIDDETDLT